MPALVVMGAGTRGGCKAGRPPRSRDFLPTITLGAAKTGTRFEPAPPHEQANQQKGTPMDNQTRKDIQTTTWRIRRKLLDNTIEALADIVKDADINLTNDAIRAIDSINTLRMDIDCRLDLIREGE